MFGKIVQIPIKKEIRTIPTSGSIIKEVKKCVKPSVGKNGEIFRHTAVKTDTNGITGRFPQALLHANEVGFLVYLLSHH